MPEQKPTWRIISRSYVGAHPQPLGLEQLALAAPARPAAPPARPRCSRSRAPCAPGRRRSGWRGRCAARSASRDHLAGQRVQRSRARSISSPKNSMRTASSSYDRDDLDGVAAHPERAAGEGHVVAGVLDVDEAAAAARRGRPRRRPASVDHPVDVVLRGAEAVDAGHRGDHDDVAAGQQAVGGGVPQPLDLVVDRGVLLDVGVRLRDVRLGLVVVVVRDEVLDGVVGQQLAELVGELRGERLVRAPSPGWAAAAARSARPWSPTCRCRWRRAARRPARRR